MIVSAIALHLLVKKERSLLDRIELKLGILSEVRLFAAENPSDFLPHIALLSIYQLGEDYDFTSDSNLYAC
ncbi:hypothetical protein ACEYW6_11460 [Nostoc sp. UIC 10607]|uniref:hypothetical protein n=1 Tax=Nostoc sp. UIC 10607 TaxID=3045935 RepID=UPI0039A33BAC